MNVDIHTSSPDGVDPEDVAKVLEKGGYFVLEVNVNDGERVWQNPGFTHTRTDDPRGSKQ